MTMMNSQWCEININAPMRVKLTARGFEVHKAFVESFGLPGEYTPPVVDADGWTTMQVWEFCHIYGNKLFNGCEIPIETTAQIEGKPAQPKVTSGYMQVATEPSAIVSPHSAGVFEKPPLHKFVPHKKFAWFCQDCGYAPDEPLKHIQKPEGQ